LTDSLTELEIRRLPLEDVGYVVASWEESHRDGRKKLPWREYKRLYAPIIRHLVNRSDVRMLGAYMGEKIVGWIAWTPGRLPAVHFAFTRWQPDIELRRRGVFTALLEAADVGSRFIYTHRGKAHVDEEKAKGEPGRRSTRDVPIVQALARRGVYCSFVDAREWLERNPA
jgi:hypothetical protein